MMVVSMPLMFFLLDTIYAVHIFLIYIFFGQFLLGELFVSPNFNASNAVSIFKSNTASSSWHKIPSSRRQLIQGDHIYLELLYKEGGGDDWAEIGVDMEAPKHNRMHSNFIQDAKTSVHIIPATPQGVSTAATDLPTETQVLTFVTPYSFSEISFDLSFVDSQNIASSRRTLFLNADTSTVKIAVEELIEGRQHACRIEEPMGQQFYDLDTFESQTCNNRRNNNCDLW